MKKMLAIIGSPRKGETLSAVQRFELEMKKLGDVEVEYVMLSDVALRDCLGCHNCITKGQEACWEAAKIKMLKDKMLGADAVLLASPTYNQGVTAIMKKFLDYFTYLWHRPDMFGMKFFGLATGGGVFDGVFKPMKDNVASWGGTWLGGLGVPHYEALTKKFQAKVDKDYAKKAALVMKAAEATELPRPTVGRLMGYRMWKMNAGVGYSAKDTAYWTEKGWMDKKCKYYYAAKINPVKNALAAAAMGIARRVMRSIYVGY